LILGSISIVRINFKINVNGSGQECPLHTNRSYSAIEAIACRAFIGQQALPNATAYTAAIVPNPAARLIRDATAPTVSPSATCRNVPKK
jgi:hypothetical protein